LSRVDLQPATILGMQQMIKFSSSFRHMGEFIRFALTSTNFMWIIGLGSSRLDPQVAIIEVENKRHKEMQDMVSNIEQFKVNTKEKTQIQKVFIISRF
jgi:hypothetical protein